MRNPFYIVTLLCMGILSGCTTPRPPDTGGADLLGPDTMRARPDTGRTSGGGNGDLLYRLLVAELAGQRGQLGLAVDNYLAAARETRDPAIAERATHIAIFAHADSKALAAARLWVAAAPQSLEARQVLAVELLKAGEVEDALLHLNTVLKAGGADVAQAYLVIAGLLGRERDAAAALAAMTRLAERHDQDPNAHYALAQLALQLDQAEPALAAVDRALRLRPGWPAASILRSRVLQQQERTEEALAYLRRAVAKVPSNRELRLAYARLLVQANRLPDARREFEAVTRKAPDDADALFALGLLALQAEDLKGAQGYFKRLVKLRKDASEAYFYLGQVAEARKDPEAAIGAYSSVRAGSNYLDAQVRIAALLAAANRLEAARSHLHGVSAQSAEQQVRLYLVEAELLRDAGHLDAAMGVYDQALEDLPEQADLLYARALLAEKQGRLDILEQDLGRILAKDKNNAQALNALGYTLTERTTRYDEAHGYIRRALELEPDDPAILDSMGWVQYRRGQYQEAAGYLRRALQLSNDAEIAAHLGEVLWVMGAREEARQVLDKALLAAPEDRALRGAIERLTGAAPK